VSIGSLIMVAFGILYFVFAFHEPPAPIAHLFQVPVIAVLFPEGQRVKLGRIAIGSLLILMGPLSWLLPHGSILSTLGVVVFLGLWMAARWKHGGEIAGADDAERRAQWQSFELLKRDPRFFHLQHQLATQGYLTTFEPIPDPTVYRVVYVDLWDAGWQRLLAQNGAAASHIIAYLEREAAPKRVQASLDLQTGACSASEPGLVGWNGRIPLQPMRA
jgi:hypothetical protein